MFQMHSCKVKSHKASLVTAEEYTSFTDKVAKGSFVNALQIASNQVMNEPYKVEKHQYQEEFSLPLGKNLFGLFTITVFVNHVACTMIVDTGAQVSGLKANKVEQLQVRKTSGHIRIGSIGGKQKEMKGLCADSFQFGGIEYRNLPMITLDEHEFALRFGSIDFLAFDGILGWDILHQLDFELDDLKKQFIVLKNRFRIPNPNMIRGGFPCFLTKQEDGKISLFGFDSGSKVSWIGEEAIQKYNHTIVREASALGMGVHGLEKMDLKVVEECTFYLDKAYITLRNTMSGRCQLFDNFCFDGVFGNEIFHGRRIRLINSKGMVLIA